MKYHQLITMAAMAIAANALVAVTGFANEAPPPMGGPYLGYKDAIRIPVDDPKTEAIFGALFKPDGAGPFPAVVYMPVCGGVSPRPEAEAEKRVIDHLRAKGFATLIVDPYTPRGEPAGVCDEANGNAWLEVAKRGAYDALAAAKVLSARPEIDAGHIFLHGYSQGALNVLGAVDAALAPKYDVRIAGAVAYYPYCFDNFRPKVPTLILAGEKDDITPAMFCLEGKDRPNVEIVVYPGATHAFVWTESITFRGVTFEYDEAATNDAEARTDAFMAAQMK